MKKEYGITSLTVRNLENNEFFQLLSESKDELGAFTKANKSEQVYAAKLGEETSRDLASWFAPFQGQSNGG